MQKTKRLLIIVLSLIIAVFVAFLCFNQYKKQSLKRISVNYKFIDKQPSHLVDSYGTYSSDNIYFYTYELQNDTQEYELIKTDYLIEDYQPYTLLISIDNNSPYEITDSHFMNYVSQECIIINNGSDGVWNGENISSKGSEEKEVIIWFKNDMSMDSIDEYLKTLTVQYELCADTSLLCNTSHPSVFTVSSKK